MSHPDESEYDDRWRDDHAEDGASRPVRAARPAWDAATYGRPDDTRRAHSQSATRGSTYPPDAYSPDRYAQDAYARDPYAQDPYPSAASPEPFPTDRDPNGGYPGGYRYGGDADLDPDYDTGEQYAGETNPADAYAGDAYTDQTYPGGASGGEQEAGGDEFALPLADQPKSRAGRNLPAAIGVGVVLAAAVLASLFLWRPAFLVVVVLAAGVGIWELVRAIRTTGVNPPLVPLLAGGVLMTGLAWWGHTDALTFGLMVTVLAAMVWRLADGAWGYRRDVTAAMLVAVYVPFLTGFAALLASAPEDGDLRVLVTLAGVVLSDTGGYVAGVLFGRHPMAPSVSPKKSWEGLAGSLIATALGGALLLYFLFDVSVWWGAIFGVAVSAAAVLGDLGESMIKRDLGVKDMSNLLPGHGGLMDRLDSIVFAAPTAYVLLVLMAPPL